MKSRRGRQSGAALLALVFVVVAASTYLLVLKLNAAVRPYQREQRSVSSLQEAKQALIAYAVNYPIDHPDEGPGYLPCPDRNDPTLQKNNPEYKLKVGVAGGSCGLSTGSSVGRFPWKTLKTGDIRDQNGERPWYAVSDNFRSNPKLEPMNSDVSTVAGYYDDDLVVDGEDDIAAVVFVPGVPMDGQERDTVTNLLDVTNYLDGVNADGDTDFSSRAGNDRLAYITRQELMEAIEKRVLGDVAKAFGDYQGSHGGYTWLSPFADPSASEFRGVAGTYQGHIPFHWAGEPAFTTDVSLSWNITDSKLVPDPAVISSYGSKDFSGTTYYYYGGNVVTPDQDCIESNVCTDENYAGLNSTGPLNLTGANCTWSDSETFNCTATYTIVTEINHPWQVAWGTSEAVGDKQWILSSGNVVRGKAFITGPWWIFRYAYTESVTRTYTITMTFTDNTSVGAAITEPDTSTVRRRNITLEDNGFSLYNSGPNPNSVFIVITDDRKIVVTEPGGNTEWTAIASRTLTNDEDTTGTIAATGIQYDIDMDGFAGRDTNADGDFDDLGELQPRDPEIPEWFVKNRWQDLIYVAYPSAEALPGDDDPAAACDAGTNCLTLNGAPPINNNKRAIVMAAGAVLPTNLARPNASRNAYFEGENAEPPNEIFEKSATNNDQIRVIATPP